MPRSMIKLSCTSCSKVFDRCLSEHKRNVKDGMKPFCSRRCSHIHKWNYPLDWKPKPRGRGYRGVLRDGFAPFRNIMKSMAVRVKARPWKAGDVDLAYLKELWERQDGICPYTGWKMKIDETTKHTLPLTPDRASLDRIDSCKPYEKGNVVFVSWMWQCAKNKFTPDEVLDFCRSVTKNYEFFR